MGDQTIMKNILYKILPRSFWRRYYATINWLRYIPRDERVGFNVRTINAGHFAVKYRGIEMVRCPFDYVMYQMIVSEIKPDLIIEIGTNVGGTTLYLADLMDKIGHGEIHSIDIDQHSDKTVAKHPRVKLFFNGWAEYDLDLAKPFNKILVIEDSSHTYENTLSALEKFWNLVSIGSYFIVEDGILSRLGRERGFHGGPLRAIREFLGKNDHFTVDRKYCDMFGKNATWNVNGYLKRIK